MKIVHIVPNAPYNDYWGYQDNLLPKYQKKLGHDVTIIVPNLMHKDGRIVETACGEYVLNDGVRVIRRSYRRYFNRILTNLNSRLEECYSLLVRLKPDFIFFHGLVSTTIFDAIKYKNRINRNCVIVQDNHQDSNNTMSKGMKGFLVNKWYVFNNKKSIKYVNRVYGVTPLRGLFAKDYFKIPVDKIGLLYMGGDDEKIFFTCKDDIRKLIRKRYDICNRDFLIITGGKIDKTKNIHLLMQAVAELNRDDLKLIVFGQPNDEMSSIIDSLSQDPHIRNIGWVESSKVYDYFLASDLAVFPGTHSVLWEQAAACGVPLLVKDWKGMHHIDVGGNCQFLKGNSIEELKEMITKIYTGADLYKNMLKVATEKGRKSFSYQEIAKQAIEENIVV